MKNGSRNKLLLCFRPVGDMELEAVLDDPAVDCSSRGVLSYFEQREVKDSENSLIVRKPKQTFSRAIKTIVFETTRRIRHRKPNRKPSSRLNCDPSTKGKRASNREDGASMRRTSTDSSEEDKVSSLALPNSSGSSPACSCSISESIKSSESMPLFPCQDHENHRASAENPRSVEMGSSVFNSVVCLLLVILTVTVFWGRICAIFFTSIWMYFCTRQHVADLKSSPDRGLVSSRDRVIMEGLFGRKKKTRGH